MLHAGTESKDGGRKTVIKLGGVPPPLCPVYLSVLPSLYPSLPLSTALSVPASLHLVSRYKRLFFHMGFDPSLLGFLCFRLSFLVFPNGRKQETGKKKNLIHSVAGVFGRLKFSRPFWSRLIPNGHFFFLF